MSGKHTNAAADIERFLANAAEIYFTVPTYQLQANGQPKPRVDVLSYSYFAR